MSRSKLGRGLRSIIPEDVIETPVSASRDALRLIRLDRIRPNPEQPRMTFSAGALDQLAESIRNHGVITPILVRREERGDGFVLIAGERRLRASGLAGLEEVPAWVRDDVDTQEQLELALVENIQREDLDPIETAESYARLVETFSLTQAEVARRVGKDRATVANAIRLLRLPAFALHELRSGTISAGHGKALLGLPDDEQLRRVLSDVIRKQLSVRATERMVKAIARPTERRGRTQSSPLALRLSDDLSRRLGTRVKVEPKARGGRGRIVIDYFSPDELDRLIQTLGQDEQ